MGRAYRCDDCGKLYEGLADTISITGAKARSQAIEVGLGNYAEVAQENLKVFFTITKKVEDERHTETVELCPTCQVAAVLRAAITLAWRHGVPLYWDEAIGRLCVAEVACLFLVEPKDEPEKPKKSRRRARK